MNETEKATERGGASAVETRDGKIRVHKVTRASAFMVVDFRHPPGHQPLRCDSPFEGSRQDLRGRRGGLPEVSVRCSWPRRQAFHRSPGPLRPGHHTGPRGPDHGHRRGGRARARPVRRAEPEQPPRLECHQVRHVGLSRSPHGTVGTHLRNRRWAGERCRGHRDELSLDQLPDESVLGVIRGNRPGRHRGFESRRRTLASRSSCRRYCRHR